MPRFSWNTLPVAFHSSNVSAPIGMYNTESLNILARYSMVTIEKWQGMNGLFPNNSFNWLNCQNGTDVTNCGCCTEDNIVEVGKAIKEVDPTTLVIGYHHSYIGYPIYRNGQILDSSPEWWLKDENGTVIHWNGNESWVYWDHGNKDASEEWKEGCLNITKTGHIDGCFFDGCIPSTDGPFTNAEYKKNKKASMIDAQNQVDGPIICGSGGGIHEGLAATQIQNWGKTPTYSTREIPMLMKAVDAGKIFEAHALKCPENANDQHTIDNIASFLIAAGPYSYFLCGGWNSEPPIWYPIYDFPLGEPLSNATLGNDGIWRRSFQSGTKVTFDTKQEKGTIDWAQNPSLRYLEDV